MTRHRENRFRSLWRARNAIVAAANGQNSTTDH
jgi:hypothetical protein